jgi:hypothetical protein
MGAMTGRGAGFCAGAQQYGAARFGCGGGPGFGRNRGAAGGGAQIMQRGPGVSPQSGGMATAAAGPGMEKQRLRNQVAALQTALDSLAERLTALESTGVGQ